MKTRYLTTTKEMLQMANTTYNDFSGVMFKGEVAIYLSVRSEEELEELEAKGEARKSFGEWWGTKE